MSAALDTAIALLEQDSEKAVDALTTLQTLQSRVAAAALFSRNETMDDVATSVLPLLALEHYTAVAYTQLPTATDFARRVRHLQTAMTLWSAFLRRLQEYEFLSDRAVRDLEILEDLSNDHNNDDTDMSAARLAPPTSHRDAKIARHRLQQQARQNQQKWQALQARRQRLGTAEHETMDGHDAESLQRAVAIEGLHLAVYTALDEWTSVIRELPLLARMVQQQPSYTSPDAQDPRRPRPPPPRNNNNKPLQLTHITKDATTGQLNIRRDTARETVFRRGWNQPTMTLEELAEREVADARRREQAQQQAEAAHAAAPRRYEQLVKEGLEDNEDLVDASAALDRQWDDWKDANPRGSGNKRGDVGDRNF